MYKKICLRYIDYHGLFWVALGPIDALYELACLRFRLPSPLLVTLKFKESIAVRFLLIDIFGRFLKINNFKDIKSLNTGQPYLKEKPGCNISFTHDHDLCGVCLSYSTKIGIDIQEIQKLSVGFVKRNKAISFLENKNSSFVCRAWAIQEAICKCFGEGLSGKPWEIPVRADMPVGCNRGLKWKIWADLYPNYVVAIAFKEIAHEP